MDEITKERHPYPMPWSERHAKPVPRKKRRREPRWLVDRRRIQLCGTADLLVLEAGGDIRQFAIERERRLVAAIRGAS